jgi:hypothetical protein
MTRPRNSGSVSICVHSGGSVTRGQPRQLSTRDTLPCRRAARFPGRRPIRPARSRRLFPYFPAISPVRGEISSLSSKVSIHGV